MWVPPEDSDPVLLQAPTRKSVGVFGAVRPEDGWLVVRRTEKFNTMSFIAFLKQLARHRRKDRAMLVVLDNARWHHSKKLQNWLAPRTNTIRLDHLPPYSPELNHIERVWKLTRRTCTHNRYFPTLLELIETVFNQFALWAKPNNTLNRLCAVI